MLFSDMAFPPDKKLIFYGVTGFGEDFVTKHCLGSGRVPLPDCFCDDRPDRIGTECFGRPVKGWDEIARRHKPDGLIVVVMALAGGNLVIPGKRANDWDFADIRIGRCLDMRFAVEAGKANGAFEKTRESFADEKSRIVFDFLTEGVAAGAIWCRNVYEPNPYFGNDVVPGIRDGEIYVDAGANLGEDMRRATESNPRFDAMVGFEPDGRVFDRLAKAFSDPRVEVRREGLSDRNACQAFDAGGVCGRLREGGGEPVWTVRLDECGLDGVSLIKMDVEGSEAAALRGARGIIAASRPRLAISAYHKAEDMFELPALIRDLRPGCRLFLRHHSVFLGGTVLYAV